MLELRGQNGLLEGSCVETCGMPSSHSASWRVTCRWKCLKDGKCGSTFWDPFYKINVSVLFLGGNMCFFQPGVWHDCFFSKNWTPTKCLLKYSSLITLGFLFWWGHLHGLVHLVGEPQRCLKPPTETCASPRVTATPRSVLDAISRTDTSDLEGHRRVGGWRFRGGSEETFWKACLFCVFCCFFFVFFFLFLDFKVWRF